MQLGASETTNAITESDGLRTMGHNVIMSCPNKSRCGEADRDGPGTWDRGRDNISYLIVVSHETPCASPLFHCTACVYVPLAGEWPCQSPSVCPQYLCGSGGNPALLLANVVRCRPRTTGHHGHRGGIWKQGDTRLAATSHFSQLSPFSPLPRRLSRPPGPRIMSLEVLKSARTLTGFSTHTGLLTLTSKQLAARKRNLSAHAPHMGAGKLSLTPRT
jgi:hypothetical protein